MAVTLTEDALADALIGNLNRRWAWHSRIV